MPYYFDTHPRGSGCVPDERFIASMHRLIVLWADRFRITDRSKTKKFPVPGSSKIRPGGSISRLAQDLTDRTHYPTGAGVVLSSVPVPSTLGAGYAF